MTRKVMEINDRDTYVVIKDDTSINPYKVYKKWWDMGWHRKKLTEYHELSSVLWFLLQTMYGVK